MDSIFKSFGKGLLYVLVLPFFLLVISGYAVAGMLAFIFLFFKSIILFFCGRSLNIELPEDKKAKQIIQNAIPTSPNPVINQDGEARKDDPKATINIKASNSSSASSPKSVEEACFGPKEEPKPKENEIDDSLFFDMAEDEPSIDEKREPQNIITEKKEMKDDGLQAKTPVNQKVEDDRVQDIVSPVKYSPKQTKFHEMDDEIGENSSESKKGVDIHFKDF
ncbi:MAG TPA: hypothetical protein PKO28_03665 [Bacilli bacterium]|nr:hypothetical protein [Bacilli bacterium]HPS18922.1 hypothetical protein [Bacilli bacterium]